LRAQNLSVSAWFWAKPSTQRGAGATPQC